MLLLMNNYHIQKSILKSESTLYGHPGRCELWLSMMVGLSTGDIQLALKEGGLSFSWHTVATSCFNDHLLLDVVNIESKALDS